MYTNADMTLYRKSTGFKREVVKDVFWVENKTSNVVKTGLQTIEGVKIFVPLSSYPDLKIETGKDIVMFGEIPFEFTGITDKEVSESKKELYNTYGSIYTVTVFDKKLFGSKSMQHYVLMCK